MQASEIKTHKYRADPPYGLQDQIRHAEDDVTELVEEVKDQGGKDVRVLLVGHSVGSYVALEIVRRLRAHGVAGDDYDTRIAGVVGLFPTVVDIARSESGMKAAVSFFMICRVWKLLGMELLIHVTAISQKLEFCAHCIADCGLHHDADAIGFTFEACHCGYGLSRGCGTHHRCFRQVTAWRPASTAYGA